MEHLQKLAPFLQENSEGSDTEKATNNSEKPSDDENVVDADFEVVDEETESKKS